MNVEAGSQLYTDVKQRHALDLFCGAGGATKASHGDTSMNPPKESDQITDVLVLRYVIG